MSGASPQPQPNAKGRGKQAAKSERHGTDGVATGWKGPKEQMGPAEGRPSAHGHPAAVDGAVPAPPAKRLRQGRAVGDHGKGHVPGPAQARRKQGHGEGGAQGQGRRGEVQGPGRGERKTEAATTGPVGSAERDTRGVHVGVVRQDAAAPAPFEDVPLAKGRRLLQTRGRDGAGANDGEDGRRGSCGQEEHTRHASGASPNPTPPLDSARGNRAAARPEGAVPGTEATASLQRQQHQRPPSGPPSPPSPPLPRQVPPPPPQQQQLLDGGGHVGPDIGANGGGGRGTTPARGASPAPPTAPDAAPGGPQPAAPAPAAADAEASPAVAEAAGCVRAKYRRTKHEFRVPLAAHSWFPSLDDGRQTVTVYGRASRDSDGGRPGQLKAFPVSLALQRGGWQNSKDGDVSTAQRKLVMSHTSKLVRWVGLGPTGQVWLRQQEVAAGELGHQQVPSAGPNVVVVMERA